MSAKDTSEEIVFSLDDLDISKASAEGFEFELALEDRPGSSGIFITVQGDHSDKLKADERRAINAFRQKEAFRVKKNGSDTYRPIEDDEQFGIESAARRVIAWRGLKDECNFANAVRLCKSRPEAIEQIVNASKNVGNFTKSK